MKLQKMMGTHASNRNAAKFASIKQHGSLTSYGGESTSSSKKALALRNLGPTDVVFGTKGNGRNEVFLQLLEEHAGLYVKSSKFEKMALIQRLIRDWKGNFFFLNPKTNELCLAREKSSSQVDSDSDDESAGLPSTSSKLYTSVRRMMNYVVAKNNYSYQDGAAASTSTSPKRKSSDTKSNKKRKESSFQDVSSAPLKKKSKKHNTSSSSKKSSSTSVAGRSHSVTRSDTLSPVPVSMGSSKRVPMLVTPEPSPRIQLLSPISFQEGEAQQNGNIHFPATFVSSLTAAPPGAKTSSPALLRPAASTTKRTVSSADLVMPRKLKLSNQQYIGRLEDTAIATLVSLSSASWSEEQTGEDEEPAGLYF